MKIEDRLYAQCSQCKKQVGCGCNLINGKCRDCQPPPPPPVLKPKKP